MKSSPNRAQFHAVLRRLSQQEGGRASAFVMIPKEASALLPRRGRTTVQGTMNGHRFSATLEPDGQLSHWLRVDEELRTTVGAQFGETVTFDIAPVAHEPEPDVPEDLRDALRDSPEAMATWESTTTIARLDWIHWITSAKQTKTRSQRILNACDMLASGKRRVCCFDPSGYYSKAFSAPNEAD